MYLFKNLLEWSNLRQPFGSNTSNDNKIDAVKLLTDAKMWVFLGFGRKFPVKRVDWILGWAKVAERKVSYFINYLAS